MKPSLLKSILALASGAIAGLAHAGPQLWIDDTSGRLGKVDVSTGAVTIVGDMGVVMFDIAFDPLGRLFGISQFNLYQINTSTAAVTLIGSLGASVSSLVFSSSGTLYAAGGSLYTINSNTGAATSLGNGGTAYSSTGDLAFVGGNLYLSSSWPTADTLLRLSTSNGARTTVGGMGSSQFHGLASSNNIDLYGVSGTNIYTVSPVTGLASAPVSYAGQGLGSVAGSAFLTEATPVPELETSMLMLAGLGVVGFLAHRRRQSGAAA